MRGKTCCGLLRRRRKKGPLPSGTGGNKTRGVKRGDLAEKGKERPKMVIVKEEEGRLRTLRKIGTKEKGRKGELLALLIRRGWVFQRGKKSDGKITEEYFISLRGKANEQTMLLE